MDYASTTPVHAEVWKAMVPYFRDMWANASAIYTEGVAVREVIEAERGALARVLHVRPSDVVFTSGGTESNNLVIVGLVARLHTEGIAYADMEIISTKIEHPSILEALRYVEALGVVIKYAPVDEEGRIDMVDLEALFSEKTRLVTFAYVNSEIGTIQDVKKITRMARAWNDTHKTHVYVHIDACQAPLWLPCALDQLGADLVSLDAGKAYGPKGVGVLVKRHWVKLNSIMYGGGQEQGLRPGTENTALIIGCVRALVRAQQHWEKQSAAIQKVRDYALSKIKTLPNVVINGSSEHRVPNNINISIPGIDGEYAVITLDAHGIAASTRSACGAGKGQGSHVVRTISGDEARALSTIRFTLGEGTKKKDIDEAVAVLKEHIKLMRS